MSGGSIPRLPSTSDVIERMAVAHHKACVLVEMPPELVHDLDDHRHAQIAMLAADPELHAAIDVGLAWREAEAALPAGWSILVGDIIRHGGEGYWATASEPYREDIRGFSVVSSEDGRPKGGKHDVNVADALRALVARLRERTA